MKDLEDRIKDKVSQIAVIRAKYIDISLRRVLENELEEGTRRTSWTMWRGCDGGAEVRVAWGLGELQPRDRSARMGTAGIQNSTFEQHRVHKQGWHECFEDLGLLFLFRPKL